MVESHKYRVLGLMSGTSLDGLDMLLVEFWKEGQWKYKMHKSKTVAYPPQWQKKLDEGMSRSLPEIAAMDMELGEYFGFLARDFLMDTDCLPELISSHGHTILHRPDQGYTKQIGHGGALAVSSGFPVVCDFRSQDVARGGQGAPLVPMGDALLFNDYAHCVNLGGFSNTSFKTNDRMAFDIAPCNLPLNLLCERFRGVAYDAGGDLASSGCVDQNLLSALDRLDYYKVDPPKSLGREWLEQIFMPLVLKSGHSMEDMLATVVEHIARQIARALRVGADGPALFTGGGVKNTFLMQRIKDLSAREIVIPDVQLVDFKEALIFALLGLLRKQEQTNVLASVTGAGQDHCAGAIYLPS